MITRALDPSSTSATLSRVLSAAVASMRREGIDPNAGTHACVVVMPDTEFHDRIGGKPSHASHVSLSLYEPIPGWPAPSGPAARAMLQAIAEAGHLAVYLCTRVGGEDVFSLYSANGSDDGRRDVTPPAAAQTPPAPLGER